MTPYSLLKFIAVPRTRPYKSTSLHGVIAYMTVFFIVAAFITLVKKFPALYGTLKFITSLTRSARHLSLS
jgi:hypothetical protein